MHQHFSDIPTDVVLTSLEINSRVLLVCDWDKAEYKCGRVRDKTKTSKIWSKDRSQVLQH